MEGVLMVMKGNRTRRQMMSVSGEVTSEWRDE